MDAKYRFVTRTGMEFWFILLYLVGIVLAGTLAAYSGYWPMTIFFAILTIWFGMGVIVCIREYGLLLADQEKLVTYLGVNRYIVSDGYPSYDSSGKLRHVHFPRGYFLDVIEDRIFCEDLKDVKSFDVRWIGFSEKGITYRYMIIEKGKQFYLYCKTTSLEQ